MPGRFESMLATAVRLAARSDERGAKIVAWRQIVDILAQAGPALDDDARVVATAELERLRSSVPASERRLAAGSLAGRVRDPGIVALFAGDSPAIAAPVVARATLDEHQWQQLIPAMPSASRNVLRNRRDLPHGAVVALARFAAGDLALPGGSAMADEDNPGVSQIRDLVDRIAAYRQRVPLPEATTQAQIDRQFVFETTIDGMIDWVEGCARDAVIGISIAEPATLGAAGVDGQAAGAWRRRAPVTDARLAVAGGGSAGGDWLISAAPLFNPRDGRFCGYRGTARRPGPGEQVGGGAVTAIDSDSLRQLVHELRTPLNAVQGFAQMIDRQMLGPAALRYRERARAIVADAERLVAMVDDLDTAARLDSGRTLDAWGDAPDVVRVVERLVEAHRPALAARGVEIVVRAGGTDEPTSVAASMVERLAERLIAAIAGVASPGETIEVRVDGDIGGQHLSASRPLALHGRDERALLDPGYGPDGEWPDAPLLGLGFTLRLIARMATEVGARFSIMGHRFELSLPAADRSERKMVGPAGLEPAT